VPGACIAVPRFPWSPALAPPAPQPVARLCSSASQLLCRSLTSPDRTSATTTHCLPAADHKPPSWGLMADPEISGSRARSFRTRQGLLSRWAGRTLATTRPSVLPSALVTALAPEIRTIPRLNGWPAHTPTEASPTPSRMPAHGSAPTWLGSGSLQTDTHARRNSYSVRKLKPPRCDIGYASPPARMALRPDAPIRAERIVQ
jgi:hypothetical protein